MKLFSLLLDLGLGLGGCADAPELAEGVHIERQVVELVFIDSNRRIDIVVELGELVHIVPDFFIARMKNMGAVAVYVDAVYILSVNISRDMVSPVDHQHAFSSFFRFISENRAKKTGSYYKIIVFHSYSPLIFFSPKPSVLLWCCH